MGGLKIEKLNNRNYHTGKQKIEMVLAFRDLHEIVFEAPPVSTAADPEAEAKFKKLDANAKVVIGLTLSDDHLEHVRSPNTAAEM
jgi:hypothetical protein